MSTRKNQSHFFAFVSRMKYINRWGLMRNTLKENLLEHSLQTAMVAHALAVIRNAYFGGSLDVNQVAVAAMYHDTGEIFTGDLPTPVKYFNQEIKTAYKAVEKVSNERLLAMLPEKMLPFYRDIWDGGEGEIALLVRAADKLTAYIKCLEEEKAGNSEFRNAKESLQKLIYEMDMPEIAIFMDVFVPSFNLTIDEIEQN